MFLPNYRGWVVVASWWSAWLRFVIEKTRLGAYLRAATESPTLVRLWHNVPRLNGDLWLRRGPGGHRRARQPIYSVNPNMGAELIIVVFAVVVIGGMGHPRRHHYGLRPGHHRGLTRVFYPEGSSVVIFVIMAIVLLIKPAGLFGRAA